MTEDILKADMAEALAEAQELLGEARAENAVLREELGKQQEQRPGMSELLAATTAGRAAMGISDHD